MYGGERETFFSVFGCDLCSEGESGTEAAFNQLNHGGNQMRKLMAKLKIDGNHKICKQDDAFNQICVKH